MSHCRKAYDASTCVDGVARKGDGAGHGRRSDETTRMRCRDEGRHQQRHRVSARDRAPRGALSPAQRRRRIGRRNRRRRRGSGRVRARAWRFRAPARPVRPARRNRRRQRDRCDAPVSPVPAAGLDPSPVPFARRRSDAGEARDPARRLALVAGGAALVSAHRPGGAADRAGRAVAVAAFRVRRRACMARRSSGAVRCAVHVRPRTRAAHRLARAARRAGERLWPVFRPRWCRCADAVAARDAAVARRTRPAPAAAFRRSMARPRAARGLRRRVGARACARARYRPAPDDDGVEPRASVQLSARRQRVLFRP